jgi:hypothetical protein
MAYEWNDTSRYGSPRHFIFDGKDQITVTCNDVLYTSFSQDRGGNLSALDPNGGPYLGVKGTIVAPTRKFRILDILSYTNKARLLIAVLRVEESA